MTATPSYCSCSRSCSKKTFWWLIRSVPQEKERHDVERDAGGMRQARCARCAPGWETRPQLWTACPLPRLSDVSPGQGETFRSVRKYTNHRKQDEASNAVSALSTGVLISISNEKAFIFWTQGEGEEKLFRCLLCAPQCGSTLYSVFLSPVKNPTGCVYAKFKDEATEALRY